ncbi:MAG: hypothetical protein CM15mP60_2700 [Alphaproteobacteria bacterium]|nr:MAG: hypothetical protein CM15mP60_2700 [Alphaproteobacteria bacterium]
MTFSIVARCAKTGQFGMAVASSSPAVAARCAYARAGVGAAASQNVTDPRLGPAAWTGSRPVLMPKQPSMLSSARRNMLNTVSC